MVPQAGACWSGSQPRCELHSTLAAAVTYSLSHRHHVLPAARAHSQLGCLGLGSTPPGTGFGGKAQSLQPFFQDDFSPPILYQLREISHAALTAAQALLGLSFPSCPRGCRLRAHGAHHCAAGSDPRGKDVQDTKNITSVGLLWQVGREDAGYHGRQRQQGDKSTVLLNISRCQIRPLGRQRNRRMG